MGEVFHAAARDGYLDLLREATRRDCNKGDEDGMTPTLWAAFYGNLDALRLIVGRGGNPDKPDHLGNTCLHHAASNGFMNCVTFLVSFGANMWALDNDFHTALDAAALNNRNEIVRFLDNACSKQEAHNKRTVKKLKQKAVMDAEQRILKYRKLQKKAMKKAEKEDLKIRKEIESVFGSESSEHLGDPSLYGTVRSETLSRFSAGSAPRASLSEPKPFSAHFATYNAKQKKQVMGGVAKKIWKKKDQANYDFGTDFKIGEFDMDGTRTIKSLSGYQRDHHVMYVRNKTHGSVSSSNSSGSTSNNTPSKSFSNFPGIPRTISEPDFFYSLDSGMESGGMESPDPEPGIFTRPGFGEVAFINKNITSSALLSLTSDDKDKYEIDDDDEDEGIGRSTSQIGSSATLPSTSGAYHRFRSQSLHAMTSHDSASIGSVGSLERRIADLPWTEDDLSDGEGDDDGRTSSENSQLELFLAANGLSDFLSVFTREKVDLPALLLLSEMDLKELGLPLGPRKKLLKATERRRGAIDKPGLVLDSLL